MPDPIPGPIADPPELTDEQAAAIVIEDAKKLIPIGNDLRLLWPILRKRWKGVLGVVLTIMLASGTATYQAVKGTDGATSNSVAPRKASDPAPPAPNPAPPVPTPDDPDMKRILSRFDQSDKAAAANTDRIVAAIQTLKPPAPPAPVDTDAVTFSGPSVGSVGVPIRVQAKLGKGASSLLFGPAPGTTASVEVVGATAIVVPKDANDIWLIASCVKDGKSVGPMQWRITVGQGPQPPPGPASGLNDAEKKQLGDLVASFGNTPWPDDWPSKMSTILSLMAKAEGVTVPAPPPAPPLPPSPVDAFTKSVQDAWVLDGKNPKIATLASVYKLSGSVVNDPANTKEADVLDKMHAAAQVALGEPLLTKVTILPNVRRLLATEFNATIGGKTRTALDANARTLIAAEFLKAQKALETCK